MNRFVEKSVLIFSWVMTAVLCLAVTFFLGYLLIRGVPGLGVELVFGQADPLDALLGRVRVFDGLWPAVIGTLCLVVLSIVLAVPLGLFSGIFLAEYAKPRTKNILSFFFDILAGIPSIVIGLFGFSIAVFLHHHFYNRMGPCLLISALSLAVLVLPYMVRSTQTALEGLPPVLRRTGIALGADKLQNLLYVLLPNALPGIGSGIILAIGRCAEDTAVILLTGVVATAGVPSSLLSQYEALPFYIYYMSNQYTNQAELTSAYGACLILLSICAVLFTIAHGLHNYLFFIEKIRKRNLWKRITRMTRSLSGD